MLPPALGNAGGPYERPVVCSPGSRAAASALFNPLYCGAPLSVTDSGNKDLQPVTSDQWSVGFVLEPTRDFSVGVDFWWIRQKELFGDLGGDVIIQSCIEQLRPGGAELQ